MSYGMLIKNKRGETIVDGVSNMCQIIQTGTETVGASSSVGVNYTPAVDNIVCFYRSEDYICPMIRNVTPGSFTLFQRYWKNGADIDYAVAQVGNKSIVPTGYGIDIKSQGQNEIINSDLRSLRWHTQIERTLSWSDISGAYDNWADGPYTENFDALPSLPYITIDPLLFRVLNVGAAYQRQTHIFKVTKSSVTWGFWLTQDTGWTLLADSFTHKITVLREK